MADIIRINSETILDFVRREGTVSTTSVEYRFGLSNRDARERLQVLADEGLIERVGLRRQPYGGVYDWKAVSDSTDAGDDYVPADRMLKLWYGSKRPGRHCVICGKPGGAGMRTALRSIYEEARSRGIDLGWRSYELDDAKAHGPCVARAQKALQKKT